jgi:serine/threonine-protein kinase HipA
MPEKEIEQTGYIYLNSDFVGTLTKRHHKFIFEYDPSYLNSKTTFNLSLSLPKRAAPYYGDYLFPFFEGLLSEGWMREQQQRFQKIDEKDSFTRLLNNGEFLIGAIKILKEKI